MVVVVVVVVLVEAAAVVGSVVEVVDAVIVLGVDLVFLAVCSRARIWWTMGSWIKLFGRE